MREFILPHTNCKSITEQVEKIAFVVSLWEARATISKRRQLLIENSETCEPMLSEDGKTLGLRLDNAIRTYDSVYFEPIAEIRATKNMRK